MKVEGYPLILDGKCGWAGVTVKDARTGFARWLFKSGHGHHHHRGGARIDYSHASQSYDRAKAFAMAFARVLIWTACPRTWTLATTNTFPTLPNPFWLSNDRHP